MTKSKVAKDGAEGKRRSSTLVIDEGQDDRRVARGVSIFDWLRLCTELLCTDCVQITLRMYGIICPLVERKVSLHLRPHIIFRTPAQSMFMFTA